MFKSNFIDEVIQKVNTALSSGTFIDVESAKIELKDLSSGSNWESLRETLCAFLNTAGGGIVVCGVREKDKKYHVTGFDRNNEPKLIDLRTKFFKNDRGELVDLSDHIFFDYYDLSTGATVAVIVVREVSDDLKFLYSGSKAFERVLTADKEIPASKIRQHQEYKADLEYAKELSVVDNAQLTELSLDKINNYINLINREIRRETLKPDLTKAKAFLHQAHFILNDQVTTLGLLVCGEDPFHFLGERSEVDCYFDTQSDIGRDKKIFRNDVISLMEESFKYIWGHIKVSRTVSNGGKSEPEYPEYLIRETINNALAHRDYTLNRFITITVEPSQHIEIKNPGSFKEKMKILDNSGGIPVRRLIPGIPETKNPKLAAVLRVFDKIESQGRGMASLVNAALDNLVDLPYYEIKDAEVVLRIPSGRLVDESIESWLKMFNNYLTQRLMDNLTDAHKAVLAYFYKSELRNQARYFTILLSERNNHFKVIEQLLEAKLIYEHPCSKETATVYVLDRVLLKSNFNEVLAQLIGPDFIHYDGTVKAVLNVVYLYTKYNQKGLKPADITPDVYLRLYGKSIDPKKYESLGRKVRKICSDFNTKGLFKKGENNAYWFDFEYTSDQTLFN